MLYRSSTLYFSLTVAALTHKWLDTRIMPLAWTAVTATCVNKRLIISFSCKLAQKKTFQALNHNAFRNHCAEYFAWAPLDIFVAIHEVGIVVRGMHFLQHLYQLWSKVMKPTFVINLLVLINSKWTKKSCGMSIIMNKSVSFKSHELNVSMRQARLYTGT